MGGSEYHDVQVVYHEELEYEAEYALNRDIHQELEYEKTNGDYEPKTETEGDWASGTNIVQISKWNALIEFLDIDKHADAIRFADLEGKEFESIDQAESFYMLYAMPMGFSVRKKERGQNYNGVVVNRSWVHSFENGHNHRLALSFEKPFLRSNRKISEHFRELVLSMKDAGVRTYQVWNYHTHMNNGWKNVGFTKSDLYRGISKKYSSWDGEDTNTAICLLESRKGPDSKFFNKYDTDKDNRLTNLFWSEGSCQLDYRLFGDALSFDATYKTNRYNKPLVVLLGTNNHDKTCVFGATLLQNETVDTYIWLMETFLECMDGKMPQTVLTDYCKSMTKALETIMPGIPHRICSWHLMKNAKSHNIKPAVLTDLRKLIYRYYEESEWENNWKKMITDHKLEPNSWTAAQYETRKKWADTFLRQHYFVGHTSTVRCESINSFLKKDLEGNLPLWMFFKYFDGALSQIDYTEMKENFKTNMTEPLPTQTSLPSVEQEVSSTFAREIFIKIKREMQRADKYIVDIDDRLIPDHKGCSVKIVGGKLKNNVVISNDLESVRCSCLYFESKGYPCRHIFVSMKNLEIFSLPVCLVNRRWLKDAKDFEYLNMDKDRMLTHPEASQNWRYGTVTKQAGITAYLASLSQESFEKSMEVIFQLNEELAIILPNNQSEQLHNDQGSNEGSVLDSNYSITNCRQVWRNQSKRQVRRNQWSLREKKMKTQHHCKTCGRTGHDKRNCHKFDKATTANMEEDEC